ncbi:iron-sulfur cluster assembly scaffold protein [Candidatus Woesebacteria bacterium]|nr:iron-sulfur cluster assembly scaffold protein [Candidatus Woesebacteria bacterium]
MDLYKEEVMDHYEHPRNQGELECPDMQGKDSNASCGDMIQFQIKIEDGKIVDAKWKGIGCAITTASASKLSEYLRGSSLKVLQKMSDEELLKEGVGFEVNPGRIKCLMLPIRVVRKLLEN